MAVILLSGTQESRRPLGFVGCVWILLRLQTNGSTTTVNNTPFAPKCAIKKISCIYLNAWLIGIYLQTDTRTR